MSTATQTLVMPETDAPRRPVPAPAVTGSRTRTHRMTNIVLTVILSLGGIIMIAPLLWTFSTSLKTREAVFALPPQWIPDPVVWENYARVWEAGPLASGILNSVIVSVSVTVVGTL